MNTSNMRTRYIGLKMPVDLHASFHKALKMNKEKSYPVLFTMVKEYIQKTYSEMEGKK